MFFFTCRIALIMRSIDNFDWKYEFSLNNASYYAFYYVFQIAVMTPQILLDALRHAFVTMSAVSLLIFDECHRACGNHPYTRIMKVMGFFLF